ncbi:DUF4838 domain-containing protein [Paenibacillus mesophilus]|uniref:DUF4838 domain-containing protein n=1 Tax=Paenibacillus mesophilus TaxID=2582849 RepID=UPI00110F51E5|nr:DUF4838 domain-containing protein [Paenibacillus mesophilus]TMV48445.1 DUF4838 domain-containing protein [Paenibacillus mesophilus]
MRKKMLVSTLVFVFTIMQFIGLGYQAKAAEIGNVELDAILVQLNALNTSGKVQHPLFSQLSNGVMQAKHQLDKGDKAQAIKKLEDVLAHLHNDSMSKFVSEAAKKQLNAAVKEAIAILDGSAHVIVRNGQANAIVVIKDNADKTTEVGAKTLIEYIKKSTGVELQLMTASELVRSGSGKTGVVLIDVGGVDGQSEMLSQMDSQGFIIQSQGERILIAGPTIWGTLNGVYGFLETYVGVRWLIPGPDGEDVPQKTNLIVPRAEVREEPAFAFRQLSPFGGDPGQAAGNQPTNVWAQRNRLQGLYNGTVSFHHNLHSLFPPEKYAVTHPEFYPDGKPPAPGNKTSWQPCFTAKGSVEAAVAGIIAYFDQNPDKTSFSLGINDNARFCEVNPSHPQYPNKLNSLGSVDMSDIYYKWVNDVVEQVLKVHPGKWFGLLAYFNVYDPPSFALNPQVVPFLTNDRMMWIDEEFKMQKQRQVEEWNKVAAQIGWYDYMYGTMYMLPRVYPHLMAENYKIDQQNHVFGNYVEMYPNIGDGPKAWLSAKLLWDPDQDVDALLQEWYERIVGPEAAPDLKAYFELWEDFWSVRIKDSPWFMVGGILLPITNASYLNLVTDEDVAESRRLITSVVSKAGSEVQQKRARLFGRMFEYYEASILSYPRNVDRPENTAAALAMLDRVTQGVEPAKERHQLIQEFSSDPALKFPTLPVANWSGRNAYEFWNLVDYMAQFEPEGGPLTNKVRELAGDSNLPLQQREVVQLLKQINEGKAPNLMQNASFEQGAKDAPPWIRWVTSGGPMERVEGVARTGEASLLVNHLVRGGPYQFLSAKPGLLASRVYYYTPPGTETQGTIQLFYQVLNANGSALLTFNQEFVPLSSTAGEWSSLVLLEEIPETVKGYQVDRIQAFIIVDSAEDAKVYIDDAVVHQLIR